MIAHIATLEKTLAHHQCDVIRHKKYVINQLNEHKLLLSLIAIPVVLWGWKKASGASMRDVIRKYALYLFDAYNISKYVFSMVPLLPW